VRLKSLEKLKNVLSDVEINEEQKLALDSFLEELYESLVDKARQEVESEIQSIDESEAREAFDLAMEDAERAFELFAEDAEAAFNSAMGDAEAAFNMLAEDLTREHAENMTRAIEDIYEDLFEKAKEEVLASPQFESLNKIKDILAPYILEESNSESLLKENKKLKEALRFINEEKEELERDQIIESLVSELPEKEKNVIRNYIEEAKTIEDIYERYNLAISLLEAKDEDEEDEEEDEDLEESDSLEEDEDIEDEDEEVQESVFYTESIEKQKPKRYTSIEEAIISTVFK
jgi:hypothetical protein